MTFFLIALLLQLQIPLPDRAALENPAVVSPIPRQAQKDYDKLWKRFLTGKEDARVLAEFDKLLKKHPDVLAGNLVQAYVDLYAGRVPDAERRFQAVLSRRPADPIALSYLAEFTYARGDFVRAHDLYTRLEAARPAASGVDMRRQRSLLLAMETLLQGARLATAENRLADAEEFYRQALRLAPEEAALHGQLAEVLVKVGKSREADEEFRLQRRLSGTGALTASDTELAVSGLEELGRWGNQVERFRETKASKAVTREQLAALLTGYFPQLTEFRQSTEVMTDIHSSWAEASIRTVVSAGVLDSTATQTFQPGKTVTRGEFALAIARLTRILGASADSVSFRTPLDVVPNSTLFLELQPVLGYELMAPDDAGNFNIGAQVSGEEAVNTAEKLLALIHKKAP